MDFSDIIRSVIQDMAGTKDAPPLTDSQIAEGWLPRPESDKWPAISPDTLVDVVFFDGELQYGQRLGLIKFNAINRYRPSSLEYPSEEGWRPWGRGWPEVSPETLIEVVLTNHTRTVAKANTLPWTQKLFWDDHDGQETKFWRVAQVTPATDAEGEETATAPKVEDPPSIPSDPG